MNINDALLQAYCANNSAWIFMYIRRHRLLSLFWVKVVMLHAQWPALPSVLNHWQWGRIVDVCSWNAASWCSPLVWSRRFWCTNQRCSRQHSYWLQCTTGQIEIKFSFTHCELKPWTVFIVCRGRGASNNRGGNFSSIELALFKNFMQDIWDIYLYSIYRIHSPSTAFPWSPSIWWLFHDPQIHDFEWTWITVSR